MIKIFDTQITETGYTKVQEPVSSNISSYPIQKISSQGETVQYIYTDSKHNNPLCRVIPIENLISLPSYDKEKYKQMILDAEETILGFFGFDRTVYSNIKKGRKKWYEELIEQRTRDIETEMM